MAFNPLGFVVASALTRDLPDRDRAAQLSLVGGLLGGNIAGVALLAAVANEGRTVGGTTTPSPGTVPSRVQVPDLDDDQEAAEATLRSRGLVPAVATVVSNDEPIDHVIGSEPPAGAIVRRGSTVTILVSAGVQVPAVTGKEVDEAAESVRTAGFEVEVARSEKTGREGIVESQDPEGGQYADGGSLVTLYEFAPKERAALHAAEPAPKEK